MTGHGHVPRTAETERLRRALDTHGLVNLTGPPGAGKSALAGELGWKHVDLEHLDPKQLGPEHLAPDLGAPHMAGGAGPDPAACADDGVAVDGVAVDGVDGPGRAAALSAALGRARPRRLL
ncbi:ATP-binding protein, partial [Streptomyces zhihengii]|uniref:ATP-binding protein n=1 Tax=Streptomyces zhihengii TaxID=1818004 RepID=UPI0033A757B0